MSSCQNEVGIFWRFLIQHEFLRWNFFQRLLQNFLFVTQDTLNTIDSFQKDYFRKALGLPTGTSGSSILYDIAVVRQSLRFEANRIKLRAKLEYGLSPDVVRKQHAAYCTTRIAKTKYFTAATRRECLENRDKWMIRNQSTVKIPGKSSFSNYRKTLTEYNSKHRHNFRGLYRNGKCKSKPWRADLTIWSCPTFPSIPENTYKIYRMAFDDIRKDCVETNVTFKAAFRKCFSMISNGVNQDTQLREFRRSSPNHTLNTLRGGWYHDPLLIEIKNPYMRLVRKARLEASELLSHTPYMSQSGSKICTHCQSNNTEDLHHFFFQCTAYNSQRVEFLERINPILRDLGLPLNDVSSVLGFPQGPASKRYFSSNKCLREQLYLETCRYMRLSQRFSYV